MKNRSCLNILLCRDRKVLYIVLGIVMVLVLTLTVVYAALSTTLNINGNAEVSAASWDIYLYNVQLNSRSVTTMAPFITNSTTVTFTTTLSKPGDFYEFTIDVINNGTIDAMIGRVTKTPELTTEQAKYLNYIIEYQNGEPINNKQLVEKNSFVRLKVKLEFRKDITASDLPTQSETLNLSFTVNYVQSDDSSENVSIDNNGKIIKVISGDGTQVGDEICIGEECFYVISSDEDSVTMLSKYNLNVGEICTSSSSCTSIENSTGIQDSTSNGKILDTSNKIIYPVIGVTAFSDNITWNGVNGKLHPTYSEETYLYKYINDYSMYLKELCDDVVEVRILNVEDYEKIGCTGANCTAAPSWFYSTSYWTGVGHFWQYPYNLVVSTAGKTEITRYNNNCTYGVRPVIVLSKTNF